MHYNVRPIQLVLKPSRVLAGASLAAIVMLAITPMPRAAEILLLAVVILSCACHVADCLLRLPRSLTRLELNGKEELHVTRRDGKSHRVDILPGSFVTPYLTILNMRIRDTGKLRHLLVTPDRVQQDEFRRLRVWLRWGNQVMSEADAVEEV
jgi:toxin CptA